FSRRVAIPKAAALAAPANRAAPPTPAESREKPATTTPHPAKARNATIIDGCPNRRMPQFTHHIFICINRREPASGRGCCNPDGSEALRTAFKKEVERRGLKPLVRANASGCLDQC